MRLKPFLYSVFFPSALAFAHLALAAAASLALVAGLLRRSFLAAWLLLPWPTYSPRLGQSFDHFAFVAADMWYLRRAGTGASANGLEFHLRHNGIDLVLQRLDLLLMAMMLLSWLVVKLEDWSWVMV